MVSKKGFALLALAAASFHVLPAGAADYDPPIYTEQAAEEYVPVEVGNGWYLRGDVGYVIKNKFDSMDYRTFTPGPGTYTDGNQFATTDFNSDFTFGVGAGYRFTDYLRADATVDGFRSSFSGTTTSANPCTNAAILVGTGCRSENDADVDAYSILANGYVDLGTYVGFTPYVGAGAGYTYVKWSDLNNRIYCTGANCPAVAFDSATQGGRHDWRFTYALMAGVAYDINKALKLDVGYRYRDVDDGNAYGFNQFDTAAGATGAQGHDKGWSQHEVKVGLRYELW